MLNSEWRMHIRSCLFVAWLVVAPWSSEPAAAQGMPTKPFVYKAVNMQLVDLLRDFAGAQALPLVIADGVTGVVNGNFQLTPKGFLETVSKAFGLIWYFDGVALYVYPSNQIQTRLIAVKNKDGSLIEAKLNGFGLGDRRYPLRYQADVGLVLVFGPPRHIELVEAIINAMAEQEDPTQGDEVRSFALVYASATDRTVQGLKIPGVATTLGSVFQDKAPSATTPLKGSGFDDVFSRIHRLEGTPEQRANRDRSVQDVAKTVANGGVKPPERIQPMMKSTASSATQNAATPEAPAGRVTISADEATNTVIVRAPAEKMQQIEKLVAKLDVANEMVEIEVQIIDIATDEAQSLGVDWRYQSDSTDVLVSPNSNVSSTGAGFNITTLFRGSALQLLARVRALESRGSARLISHPKVLGAANRTALLQDKRTASVRVAGNQDAQLFSVESGTTLSVLPRIILDPKQTRIAMELLIEDGSFSAQIIDSIPVVQRTTIRTDVMVNEGQSILIGGIASETSSNSRSAVPWLSRLPFVGGAFRTVESAANQRQRIFMLTPKRVVLQEREAAVGTAREAPTQFVFRETAIPAVAAYPESPIPAVPAYPRAQPQGLPADKAHMPPSRAVEGDEPASSREKLAERNAEVRTP